MDKSEIGKLQTASRRTTPLLNDMKNDQLLSTVTYPAVRQDAQLAARENGCNACEPTRRQAEPGPGPAWRDHDTKCVAVPPYQPRPTAQTNTTSTHPHRTFGLYSTSRPHATRPTFAGHNNLYLLLDFSKIESSPEKS